MASVFILRYEYLLQEVLSMLSIGTPSHPSQHFIVRYNPDGGQTSEIGLSTTGPPEGGAVVFHLTQLAPSTAFPRGSENERTNAHAFLPWLVVESLQYGEHEAVYGRRAGFT